MCLQRNERVRLSLVSWRRSINADSGWPQIPPDSITSRRMRRFKFKATQMARYDRRARKFNRRNLRRFSRISESFESAATQPICAICVTSLAALAWDAAQLHPIELFLQAMERRVADL